jgi:hypothetical protein
MVIVPLNPVPSQTVNVTVGGQVARITVRTIGAGLYFSLDGVVTNRVCRDRARLLTDAKYRGFLGDFSFVDTKGRDDPQYWGLGDRWQLVYGE